MTPFYTAILGLIFIALSVRTLILRRRYSVGIGYGNEEKLERAVRAHANFAEYVPLGVLLIYFLEQRSGTNLWIHILGTVLILGRLVHAFGISRPNENGSYRVLGMACTFTVIGACAIRLAFGYIR